VQDHLIAKAQDLKSACRQDSVTFSIGLRPAQVRLPVQFDHQSRCVAVEIHDKPGDNLLASEVKSAQAICAQLSPQDLLRRRHLAPELAGTFDFGTLDPLPDHDIANGRI
jgi:hypothetical protein